MSTQIDNLDDKIALAKSRLVLSHSAVDKAREHWASLRLGIEQGAAVDEQKRFNSENVTASQTTPLATKKTVTLALQCIESASQGDGGADS